MTDAGVRTVGNVTILSRDAEAHLLGLHVEQALRASARLAQTATEQDWQPFCAATGLSTLKDFMLAAALVTIDADHDGTLTIARAERPDRGNEVKLSVTDGAFEPIGRSAIGDAVARMVKVRSIGDD